MSKKLLSKTLRVITIAPFMALILLSLIYIQHPEYLGGLSAYILAVLFLVVFPVLAYPLQPFIPKFRGRGREGQRNLAMVMAGIGYCLGIITAIVTKAVFELRVIYLTYFISGVLIIVFNKMFGIRASGHACGAAGPVFAMIYLLGPLYAVGFALLIAVYWSSLYTKRHTLFELLLGTAVPLAALLLSIGISQF
ncbi:MAG: hypothetical protein GX254_10045 [Clostridiales bacterium]|jgi:hypothetical protein|nr:hypothetical protein [Clostridiales bacterium]